MKPMRIIIVGCGKIGTAIIASLVAEGHDVVAVDTDPSVTENIGNIYDVISVCGNGTDHETLSEAGVDKADLFISVAGSDETNMLSCFFAQRMGAKHTIARIRNPEYNDKSMIFIRQHLGLAATINPDWLAAQEIFRILKLPAAVNVETFSGGNLEMVELKLKPDSPLDGAALSDLRRKFPAKFLICAVQREGKVYIPDGNFVLQSGDRIGLTAPPGEIIKLLKMMDVVSRQTRSSLILGASRISYYLAKRLLPAGSEVTIIDKDEKRCREFSSKLPGATMIGGDGAQQELLIEEGIDRVDAFLARTGMDEENILISIFAEARKVPKVVTKVNRDELYSMAHNLGLDTVISPRRIVSDIVLRYARALQNSLGSNVETLYKLMDGSVEAVEFKVSADFKGVKTALKDLKLKPGILIAGIIKGRKAMIPTGEDMILSGDRVVVIVSGKKLFDLSDILE